MANLLGYAGAGLLSGVGKGMVEQGQEEGRMARDSMLAELRRSEGALDRESRASENALNRESQAGERQARVGLLSAQADYYGRRTSGTAASGGPLVRFDPNTFKILTGDEMAEDGSEGATAKASDLIKHKGVLANAENRKAIAELGATSRENVAGIGAASRENVATGNIQGRLDAEKRKADARTAEAEARGASAREIAKIRADSAAEVARIRGETAESVAETGAGSRVEAAGARETVKLGAEEKDALRRRADKQAAREVGGMFGKGSPAYEAAKGQPGFNDETWKENRSDEIFDELVSKKENRGKTTPAATLPAPQGGQPKGATAPGLIEADDEEAPPAPRDPAQRRVGQVYTAPSGARATWTGQGWKPVD